MAEVTTHNRLVSINDTVAGATQSILEVLVQVGTFAVVTGTLQTMDVMQSNNNNEVVSIPEYEEQPANHAACKEHGKARCIQAPT